MGDVAQILGVQSNSSSNSAKHNNSNKPPIAPPSHVLPKSIQNASVILNSKPVLKVLSSGQSAPEATHSQRILSTSLPPIVPSHNLPLQTVSKRGASLTPNATPSRHIHTDPASGPSINNVFLSNQISYVKINNKAISTKKARSWVFAPFTNSARKDGLKLHHWVRAGVEYPEYPYARFNVHLDELSYRNEVLEIENANNNNSGLAATAAAGGGGLGAVSSNSNNNGTAIQNRTEEEINAAADLFYEQHLQHKEWSQSETDTLLELCRVYQLRWPVIMDRWIGKFGTLSSKRVEDLQHRYYTIGYILNRMKVERAAKLEAENLAKAMAAANQSVSSVVGSIGVGGVGASPDDVKENETLKAKHMLSTTIATSTSTAINALIGEVKANLQPPVSVPHTGTSNQPTFDLEAERQRRQVLDYIWARTKEEELEEIELKNELKLVEAQIRKMKKSGEHILAAKAASAGDTNNGIPGVSGGLTSASSIDSKPLSRGQSPTVPNNQNNADLSSLTNDPNNILKSQFAPIPTPGTPYLQSGRQKQPSTNNKLGINKTTLKCMDQVLKELKVLTKESSSQDSSSSLLPTKRVCDLYDHVRRDALTLLSLQKVMLKRENDVISRRMKLEKMSGTIVQQQREAAAAAAAAAEAAEAAAKAAAEAAAAAKSAKSAGSKKNAGNTASGSGNSKSKSSSSSTGNNTGSGSKSKSKSSTERSSSTSNKKSSSSSKKSKSSSVSSSKGGTKEKKTKKKSGEGGSTTTKKRKSAKKKDGGDSSSKKGSSSSNSNSAAAAAAKASSSSKTSSTIISNNAGGTGVVVGSSTAMKASSSSSGAKVGGSGSITSTTTAATTTSGSGSGKTSKKGNVSTLDADGKPAKKRVKKSNNST